MIEAKERFLVDSEGNRIGVLLDIADYERIVEELEELDDIRAYDQAKSTKNEFIPFRKAVDDIESGKR